MIEFLVELFGEFLLQFFVEVLAEFGLQALAAPFRRDGNPWLAALGYTVFGAAAGGLSLLVFPHHFVGGLQLRLVNLAVTPVSAGLMMCLVGRWRAKRGDELLRIDRFAFGYLFAVALGLVRYFFAG